MSNVSDKLKYIEAANKQLINPFQSTQTTTTTGGSGTTYLNPYTTGGQSGTVTTTGMTYPSSVWQGQLGQYQPITYTPYTPPSLPIKLNIRELVALMRALEKDEELKGIIQKFQPFIGVEV